MFPAPQIGSKVGNYFSMNRNAASTDGDRPLSFSEPNFDSVLHVQIGFNLEVGGYFSIKRNAVSMDGDTFIRQDQVVAYCKAMLEVFRCGTVLFTFSLLPLSTNLADAVLCCTALAWHDAAAALITRRCRQEKLFPLGLLWPYPLAARWHFFITIACET